jgi:hypothetical protein
VNHKLLPFLDQDRIFVIAQLWPLPADILMSTGTIILGSTLEELPECLLEKKAALGLVLHICHKYCFNLTNMRVVMF